MGTAATSSQTSQGMCRELLGAHLNIFTIEGALSTYIASRGAGLPPAMPPVVAACLRKPRHAGSKAVVPGPRPACIFPQQTLHGLRHRDAYNSPWLLKLPAEHVGPPQEKGLAFAILPLNS